MIIAIDGPAASGKGTIARRLAKHFDLPHLDTGLLYRATARVLIDEGTRLDDVESAVAAARGLALTEFDEEKLRGREMGEAASVVGAMPDVRAALIDMQRRFVISAVVSAPVPRRPSSPASSWVTALRPGAVRRGSRPERSSGPGRR